MWGATFVGVLAFCNTAAWGQQMPTNEVPSLPAFQVGWDPSQIVVQNVSYTDGTAPLQGFLAYDNTTMQARPAVVVLPDWDGIGPYEMWRAKLLAQLGYVAFVADIYSQNIVQGPSLPQANRSALTSAFSSNPALYVSRIQAALDEMRGMEMVDEERLAAYGYCFGGAGVLQLMAAYPNGTDGLLGVVGFHPSLPSKFVQAFPANNPIQAMIYLGYNDMGSPPTTTAMFQTMLNATNATWSFTEFGQTVHAFTEPSLPTSVTNMPASGMGYNSFADLASWWGARGFLRNLFGTTDMSNPYTEAVMPLADLATQ